METVQYEIGDMVYAAEDIYNDGGMPGVDDEDALIVPAGARGVVVHFGHTELNPEQEIYLVRFESGPDDVLGDPIGVLPEELTQNIAVDA
ncbi:nitrogen fixation protein NifZ [Azonexus hydrophilus]|uniref:Nitrogen fixation protein NifZ n=1 Tax=Azonexus hydrophilus TaxID=418702 RepID=A0A1R1I001_9RHOO|nr:nitrogen fixation protein NifZ [Azonexus hydrophilus]OMG52072.1 nitrogen fixation protein NifZ [Azonexus hydrophilus]